MLAFLAFSFVTVYLLLQQRKFPRRIARVLSRVYFYPTLPIALSPFLVGVQPWWSRVDDTLYVGALPLPFMGHIGFDKSSFPAL